MLTGRPARKGTLSGTSVLDASAHVSNVSTGGALHPLDWVVRGLGWPVGGVCLAPGGDLVPQPDERATKPLGSDWLVGVLEIVADWSPTRCDSPAVQVVSFYGGSRACRLDTPHASRGARQPEFRDRLRTTVSQGMQ
jgi:hypothetical protein